MRSLARHDTAYLWLTFFLLAGVGPANAGRGTPAGPQRRTTYNWKCRSCDSQLEAIPGAAV